MDHQRLSSQVVDDDHSSSIDLGALERVLVESMENLLLSVRDRVSNPQETTALSSSSSSSAVEIVDLVIEFRSPGLRTVRSSSVSTHDTSPPGVVSLCRNKIQTFHDDRMIAHENRECVICMDTMDMYTKIVIYPCTHAFHAYCIDRVIQHNDFKCPTCRSPVHPSYIIKRAVTTR